ncbi:MAG: hypothetical protein AAF762_13085 [Pseudomonadota bacterium]
MLTSPGFILLYVIGGVTWLLSWPVTKAVERAKVPLTADELKTFQEQYARKVPLAEMPSKYVDLATAQRKAGRIWIASTIAITLALLAIIFAGPGLGVVPYP